MIEARLYDAAVEAVPPGGKETVAGAACAVCGERRAVPRMVVPALPARIVVCTECGTGRIDPLPSPEDLGRFYPPSYYGALGEKFRPPVEAVVRYLAGRHARFLARGLPPGARILDVGCGRGVVLGRLAAMGFEAHGLEISADAARGVDPRAHLRIAPGVEAAGYPDAFFDAVLVWHVLEHVTDPAATLAAVRRAIKPGGRLIVAVPNFASAQSRWAGPAWFHLDPPRHLWHFPVGALRRLCSGHGFEVRSEHHFSLRQNPFGWIQSALNRTPGLPRNGLYLALYRHGRGAAAPFSAPQRAALLLAMAALAGPALAASVLDAALRSGATVHVVAHAS